RGLAHSVRPEDGHALGHSFLPLPGRSGGAFTSCEPTPNRRAGKAGPGRGGPAVARVIHWSPGNSVAPQPQVTVRNTAAGACRSPLLRNGKPPVRERPGRGRTQRAMHGRLSARAGRNGADSSQGNQLPYVLRRRRLI